ncbi:hypothetical protein FRX31_023382 [Thalictrum thalictroides]|uniref:Uncharacterized protein n=1 Tax=Thalictrum thalictroides TaxID=46969 RepID=A0A7J6VQ75_THATH|nr:hypothetical protein FRX31_023382 [Thalictrum thalictroides]
MKRVLAEDFDVGSDLAQVSQTVFWQVRLFLAGASGPTHYHTSRLKTSNKLARDFCIVVY